MKHAITVAVAAVLFAAAPATAEEVDHLQQAVELAKSIEHEARIMMSQVPRVCRMLRRAAKAAEEAEDAATLEMAETAIDHCRRSIQALRNGNGSRASHRLDRLIATIDGDG